MASKSPFRVTISVDGTDRSLMSLSPTHEGGLMVSVKCAEVFFGDSRGVAGRNRLVRQRYNIHSSIHDPRATTIKKITELEGEPRVEGYIRTTAIKSKNLFAPLYFKLSPDLASDRYSSFETAGRKHILNRAGFAGG